ncbi:MAG: hypothetical protein RR364_06280 [Lachnospiraceae bacterium]
MKRSKKMVLVAHCLLNVNSKVAGIATSETGEIGLIEALMRQGYGIIQLPCVEQDMCGIRRWGQVEEQLNHPHFRQRCVDLLTPILMQVEDFIANGYDVAAVIGLNGSPSCGITRTCSGDWSGEIGDGHSTQPKLDTLHSKDTPGVMMQVLMELLQEKEIKLQFLWADEGCPEKDHIKIIEKLTNKNQS